MRATMEEDDDEGNDEDDDKYEDEKGMSIRMTVRMRIGWG